MDFRQGLPDDLGAAAGSTLKATNYAWEACCDDLAAQSCWWVPGTQSGYHQATQGYLIGEVVRRVTGTSIGQFFKGQVAEVVGADFQIGVDPADFPRIADLVAAAEPASILETDADSIPGRVFSGAQDITPEVVASTEWRVAEIPAGNGHGNARSIVRAQSALANGGSAFGARLLSATGCARALEVQTDGMDVVLGLPIRFTMGYALPTPDTPISPNPNTLWWCGAGGSAVVVDADTHLCFSYVMNQMENYIVGDPRVSALAVAVYESLGSS